MLPGSEKGDPVVVALEGISRHLGITVQPDYTRVTHFEGVLPQFGVGFHEKLEKLELPPNLSIVGNYLKGGSVSDCIGLAKETAEEWASSSMRESISSSS